MDLPRSRAVAPALEVLDEIGSTNAELAARVEPDEFTVLVTTNQTTGRGRLDRSWVAPAGTSLAVSVLLPRPAAAGLGWVPLLAGLAMRRAVASLVHGPVALKWPNDVQVGGRKISGILAELVSGGVVVGAGLNLTMTHDQLPTPTATSLTLEGAHPSELADRALAAYLLELRSLATLLSTDAPALRAAVADGCDTLGRQVRVELPGGDELRGTAIRLDELGRLVVLTTSGEALVAAGDITHLRTPDTDVR